MHPSPVFLKILFAGLALLCLSPWVDPPLALGLGLVVALLGWRPEALDKRLSTWTLQGAVVGLGFGMQAAEVLALGWRGLALTGGSLVLTLALGWALGRWLQVPARLSWLLGCGTAICGGSAIAAMAPVIDASDEDKTLALGTVFLLNAIALFAFPWLGAALQLSQQAFGIWAALAIHDTSAVVGAAARYGPEALQLATALKLQRALWIVPLTVAVAAWLHRPGQRVQIPWFMGLFVLAVGLRSLGDAGGLFPMLALGARHVLTLALFLTGANLDRQLFQRLSPRPVCLGLLLWLSVASASLAVSLWFAPV